MDTGPSTINYRVIAGINAYFLVAFLVQSLWVARMPHAAFRVDLLLPLVFAVAHRLSALNGLGLAFLWGFVFDVFTGQCWGFHVGAYLVTVCLVNLLHTRFEFSHAMYQMLFVGACSLGQSAVLGLLLWTQSPDVSLASLAWESLLLRAVVMMVLTPLVIAPIYWLIDRPRAPKRLSRRSLGRQGG